MTHTPTPWTNEPGTFWICDVGNNTQDPGVWSTAVPASGPYPFGEKLADAARIVACVNFFHGRDIPTENIPEGGFWEMVQTLRMYMGAKHGAEVAHADEKATALLTKLGIDP